MSPRPPHPLAFALTLLLLATPTAAQTLDASADAAPDDAAARTGDPEGAALPDTARAATEIVGLSARACLRVLVRAGVPFERVRWGTSGIVTPVTLLGPVGGVTIHASRGQPVRETVDCPMAVALVRWARFLRGRGVREVRHLSMHRPPTHAEAERDPVQSRHEGGLAVDAGVFVLDDGTEYSVVRDFQGSLGAPVCGPTARVPRRPEARFLRRLFCDAAREGLFHVMLSPNHNDEHRNHFHLEVTRGVSWLFVR